MLLFIPINDYSGKPKCAFLEASGGGFFYKSGQFSQIFESAADVNKHPEANRFRAVTPIGFWESTPVKWRLDI